MGLQNWMAPAVAHAYTDRSRDRFRGYVIKLSLLFMVILLPMLLVLGVLTKPALQLLYHDFSPNTTWLVLILAAGSLMQSANFIYSRGLFSLRKGALDVWTNVIPLVVLIALGVPLSHQYGALGGATALLVAQALTTIVRGALFWNVCRSPRENIEAQNRPSALPASFVEAT
jgi:O-antigen/teichoic acid export membrane protein